MKYVEPVFTIPTTKCVFENEPTTIKENSVKNTSNEKINKKEKVKTEKTTKEPKEPKNKDKKKSKKLL